MAKRKKWSEDEDAALRHIVHNFDGGVINWNEVAQRMAERGFGKASRQVRERWSNHLDPKLEQASLKTEDDRRLLDLHIRHGNAWKTIAKSFKGRSDNRIKNQFFSMIRKSLRNARRCLKKSSNTEQINSIKPFVLSKFISESLVLPSHLAGELRVFPWSRQNPVNIRSFVEFFLLNKFASFEADLSDKTSKLISFILDHVKKMNADYCKEAKKPPLKRRKISRRVPQKKQLIVPKKTLEPPKVTKAESVKLDPKNKTPSLLSETQTKKLVLNDNLSENDWQIEQHTVRFHRSPDISRHSYGFRKDASVSIGRQVTPWQQSPLLLRADRLSETPIVLGARRSLESLDMSGLRRFY